MDHRYAVYAYEQIYGGLHGMFEKFIMTGTLREVEDEALQSSIDVINSYIDLYDELSDEVEYAGYEKGSDEYFDALDELIQEDAAWEVYQIRNDVTASDDELEREFYDNDLDEFVAKYCICENEE